VAAVRKKNEGSRVRIPVGSVNFSDYNTKSISKKYTVVKANVSHTEDGLKVSRNVCNYIEEITLIIMHHQQRVIALISPSMTVYFLLTYPELGIPIDYLTYMYFLFKIH